MTTGGFFGSGGKSWSWGKLNDNTQLNRWVGGRLVDVGQPKQQTHYTQGTPLTNKDGSPKMELPITLLCDGSGAHIGDIPAPAGVTLEQKRAALTARNPHDPTDTGRWTFWVKGSLKKALGDKLREAGVNEPPIGCEIYMRFTGTTSYDNGEGRVWEILYFPPSGGQQAGGFFTDERAAPQAPPANGAWGAPPAQQVAPEPPGPPAGGDPWGSAPAAQTGAQPAAPNPWG